MTRFKQHVHTQTYIWLINALQAAGKWLTNDFLWNECPYTKLDITRQEFDELIRQMKEVEGWQ